MELKNMLLSILSNKLSKTVEEIYKYLVTVARIIYTAKWKVDYLPLLKEWIYKLLKYEVMASYNLSDKHINHKTSSNLPGWECCRFLRYRPLARQTVQLLNDGKASHPGYSDKQICVEMPMWQLYKCPVGANPSKKLCRKQGLLWNGYG